MREKIMQRGKLLPEAADFGDFPQEADEKFGAGDSDDNTPTLLDRLNVYRYNICGNPRKAQCGAFSQNSIEERKAEL